MSTDKTAKDKPEPVHALTLGGGSTPLPVRRWHRIVALLRRQAQEGRPQPHAPASCGCSAFR